jgi:hypothetical protein
MSNATTHTVVRTLVFMLYYYSNTTPVVEQNPHL